MNAVRRGLAGGQVAAPSSRDGPTEAGLVPHFRPHAKIGAHPELLDVEVLSDFGIVEFVLFLLRNRARNDRDVGDSFTLRQFIRSVRRGRHE